MWKILIATGHRRVGPFRAAGIVLAPLVVFGCPMACEAGGAALIPLTVRNPESTDRARELASGGVPSPPGRVFEREFGP